jgi:hypothetical protein
MHRQALGAFALIAFFVVLSAAPAGAAGDGSAGNDRRISISGGIVVASGEVVNGPVVSVDGPVTVNGTVKDDVYVGDGRLIIRGKVTGNVLVVHGDILITGRVGDNVVALDGRITTRDGAHVSGDVVSRKAPDVASGTVSGDVKKLNVKNLFAGFLIAFLIYLWIAVTASVALLGFLFVLLFPRAADATAAAGRKFWRTVGWGALLGIVGPILAVLVLVTVIGIPFGLGMFSALNVLAPLGYVASSLIFGRLMVKGTSTGARIGAFFAGFGILRAAALLPGIGVIVWVLVCMYGLGALAQAAWRAGRRAPERAAEGPPDGPPAVPPPEPPSAAPDAAPDEQPPELVETTALAAGAPAPGDASAGEAPPEGAPD